MTPFTLKDSYNFDDLVAIIALLRSPDGCPWDREQTHESIRKNFIEEVYECIEAIDSNDNDSLKEELGDVLLQVVLHADMERDAGTFDIDGVCDGICKKLIYRHPHIFSDTIANSTKEVLKNWEDLKKAEKRQKSQSEVLKAVPKCLPGLMRAQKLQEKAAKVGFDWEDIDGPVEKLHEELGELMEVLSLGTREEVLEELGDLLFSVVNLSRFLNVDAEEAIYKACEKFTSRFSYIEDVAKNKLNKSFAELTLKEMDKLWDERKIIERE